MAQRKTIAILGGGSAGLTAARTAHELGARVLFFTGSRGDYASLCIERGCMPSKALFEPIDAMQRAQRHGWLTVEPRQPAEFLGQIVAWKDREIAEFRRYRKDEIARLAAEDFVIVRADARFVGENEIDDGSNRHRFDAAIIATGSSNSVPEAVRVPIGPDGVWTNDEILANTAVPKSLVIVGAGPVALEFSIRYAWLGCSVTIISRAAPLAKYPQEFGARLQRIYEREGVRFLVGHELLSLERNADEGFRANTRGPAGEVSVESEKVLLATGRHPEFSQLNLDAIGITPTAKGKLALEMDMRVSGRRHIFAAGDVAGQRMVVHQAHIEAGIAAENAVHDGDRKWDRHSNLQIVFSVPEFAWAGQSRATAEKAGHRVATASAQSKEVGKLHLAGDDDGLGELI
ncbi:MAG TPA: NAD(P)/FAD-dependent oxidoreductase, partial [Chthoniobacterales bacterium]|nr:NAD(P)/FAD-dependent oxidoreductase [Chthoniobacterales bacterium]